MSPDNSSKTFHADLWQNPLYIGHVAKFGSGRKKRRRTGSDAAAKGFFRGEAERSMAGFIVT
ncbi:MAG: hypothetical protein CVT83_05480 [Alphaproteobacteria bacterium HGW-Alphaproteobacteria-5]|nr:MAG: hypothetical protein CVT83_05480 [Alphaproteobacteria bacterium HGW-Alphaproteobacteria-5]